MKQKLNDIILLLALLVVLFLGFTIWQLQLEVYELYHMINELHELIQNEYGDSITEELGNGWSSI